MIKFYWNGAPNPMKVALLLEELALPYEAIPIDTRKGDQFKPEYLAINPNAKAPSLQDGDIDVFDSNAILLYLADKTGRFAPPIAEAKARASMLSWLMFVASGIGPFSGQSVHFRHSAPLPKDYALNRYDYEANRHWKIVDERLAKHPFMLGSDYSIVDMAVWGWARMVPHVLGTGDTTWTQFPNIKRLLDAIDARPAAARVKKLRSSHTFKTDMDDEARRNMFPQNERLAKTGA